MKLGNRDEHKKEINVFLHKLDSIVDISFYET